jgi:small conductance mechanosensitive channel
MPGHLRLTVDSLSPYLTNAARIAAILVLAWIASRVARKAVAGLRAHTVRQVTGNETTDLELEKRVRTITQVAARALSILIWTIALLMVLHELRFNVVPLIAGAGVVGVAVGLGAQGLIKDVLSGMFLLIENQIRINDVAAIDGTSGLVEQINLRTTVLRSEDGAVHVIPNGSIHKLSNLTRDFSYAVLSLTVDYKQDPDRVMRAINEVGAELQREEAWQPVILRPLEMLGVDALGNSGVVIKFLIRTAPMKQWAVAREMNRRLKRRFEEAGIELAFPSQTVSLAPESSAGLREELRAVVREVLAERRPPPA